MDQKIIELFEKVQKIPYKVCKYEKEQIDENLKYGDCRHKSELLYKLLTKNGYEVRRLKVLFDWKDLPLPNEVLSPLKKSSSVWAHDSLEVKNNNCWIKVDCTWQPELSKKGFPIQKDWDGISDTTQVTDGRLKFILKENFNKSSINIDKDEAMKFAELLNNFLEN
jgi:hypothetical protein